MSTTPETAANAPTRPRHWRRHLAWIALLAALLATAMHMQVWFAGDDLVFAAESAPTAECIVVPGARIHDDGTPYDFLTDRLRAAAKLWHARKAPVIVLSGKGGGDRGDDEIAAMRRWLLAARVPAAALIDDPHGLRTLDTMTDVRALGFTDVIVATNGYHLPRALFLARACGLHATGVAAPPVVHYSAGTLLKNQSREVLARVYAWFDVFVLRNAAR